MLIFSVGDITPVEGVPAEVKHRLEEEAMDAFLNEMLGAECNKDAKARFRSLWDVSLWSYPRDTELTNRNTRRGRRLNQSSSKYVSIRF